jgi:spermidine/putrescine transport system permease protein
VSVSNASGLPMFFRREGVRGFALMSPSFIFALLLLAVPIGVIITFSFWTQNYLDIDTTLTLQNYREVFEKPIYGVLLQRSLIVAGSVTFLTVILAYPLAYYVAFHVHQRKALWIFLITIPFWTSYLLRIFAWKLILGYNGVVNTSLMEIGLINEPLDFILYNMNAVILTLSHAWMPFAILPIYVSLQKIDRSYLEAATDLGDGPIRRFLRVTLPLSLPGVLAAMVVVFIPTIGDYVTPKLVGGTDGLMIANMIQVQFGKANNWPLGAALAVTTMVTVTLVATGFVFFAKWLGGRAR